MGKTSASRDRDSNEKINKWNIASQEKMNTQNLDFQRENLDYQKALQQQIFQREDSAYQRTVSDMRAAGLSPLAMNGTNGSGELVPTQALNAGVAPQKQGLFNHQQEMMDRVSAFSQMAESISSLQKNAAEIRNINAQTDQVKFNNKFAQDTRDYSIARAEAEAIATRYNSLDARQKALYNQHFGIHSGMTKAERYAAIYTTMMGYPLHDYDSNPKEMRETYEDMSKALNSIDKYASPKKMSPDDYSNVIGATYDTISSTLKSAIPSPSDVGDKVVDGIGNYIDNKKQSFKAEALSALESMPKKDKLDEMAIDALKNDKPLNFALKVRIYQAMKKYEKK